MGKIKDLPAIERPREKAKRFGISSLSNSELLALIIRTGGKDNSAIDIANDIIKDNNGFLNLYSIANINFKKYKGIGENSALVLQAVFELISRYEYLQFSTTNEPINYSSLIRKYSLYFRNIEQEQCVLIVLNRKGVILAEKVVYIGTDNSLDISLKNIFKFILINQGQSFILLHNHPSGNESPSIMDYKCNDEILEASKKFNLKFIDHLIFGLDKFFSMDKQESFPFQTTVED